MADRKIHYEVAFETYLRNHGVPYVAVDETKQALFAGTKLKSFDFVVYSGKGPNLLIDVKGRQLNQATRRSSYQTWATEQDVYDLTAWEQVFGGGFKAMLLFAYWIEPPLVSRPGVYVCKNRWYELLGVDVGEYRDHMRRRSVKWQTVAIATSDFHSLARPVESWL